jgi:hypothetical protein
MAGDFSSGKRLADRFDSPVRRDPRARKSLRMGDLVRQTSWKSNTSCRVSTLLELSLTGAAIHVWERLRERVSEHPWYRHTGNTAINGKPSVLQLLVCMQLNARATVRPHSSITREYADRTRHSWAADYRNGRAGSQERKAVGILAANRGWRR